MDKKTGRQTCRFGFPKEANVDLKPILSQHAALQYVSKYASKAESQSLAFSEILYQALRNDNPDDPGIKALQRLLIHTVGERDYSAQEICHLLLQLPLYHCSRNFVCLNLNKKTNRWLRDSERNMNNENNETKKTDPSPLQRYCSRPTELSDLSLFRLYLEYKVVKGKWVKCSKENVIRVWPRPSPIKNGPQLEDFCRIKVLLHVRYRVDNLEEMDSNDSDDDTDNIAQEENEPRADWMVTVILT
ncbi:hypothetical protein RhiirB3_458091 [Rhizophagus irregularis]|nr:hypothetical protein RhiirB3_458091 [Rhizophagus irregularis]